MLSIDAGSSKVCIAEGECHNGHVTVTAFAEAEYKGETISNGVIADRAALNFLITEMIKTGRMKSRKAIITVNSSDIIAREFKLPDVKAPSLKLLVNNEMSRILGGESGYVIDYAVTGRTEDKMLEIIAYAVSKDMVANYYALLRELKLAPAALDVHANSISKLLSGTEINGSSAADSNFIAVDIGFSMISFHGFKSGEYRFSRTEVSPVQEFVREISTIKRVDVTQNDMADIDFSPEHEYSNTILSDTCRYFIFRLSEEIQKYIQYLLLNFNNPVKNLPVSIYLFGGITAAKGIGEALSVPLKVPVSIIGSIGRLTVPHGCTVMKVCNAAGALIRM